MSINHLLQPAIELIREKGINGLCRYDGCACANFAIHGVEVSIGCHKSSHHGVRVNAQSLDWSPQDKVAVRRAVIQQLEKDFGHHDWPARS